MVTSSGLKEKRLPIPPNFNAAEQLVDVSGDHAFVPPGPTDQRGPCPGLNALANHNYLPHNGVATIDQYISATNQVFGMGLDLGLVLAVYGAVMDGDGLSWSMGGPPPPGASNLLDLLTQPQGISNSHNKYECDVSPTRGDLYEYGNDYQVQDSQFKALYAKQAGVSDEDSNYSLDLLTDFRAERFQQSIENNPYFFNAPVSGVIVQPAAYTFIYRFMANKTAESPEGILTKNVLKSFFAYTGDDDNLTYTPGNERIPENWYKRPLNDPYDLQSLNQDTLAAALQYPQFLSIGGNTGKTNTFTGVDLANLTGGIYNIPTLLQGNNIVCFGFQAAIQFLPDLLQGIVKDITAPLQQLTSAVANGMSGLGCPKLTGVEGGMFQQFPGFTNLGIDGRY
ncbi:Cloroperoxidase [Saccharata proteae CBS 121410]|uniref:Cloroperoxidase n=1 Tax=Saccharata proteae CBS 121410 TaxID=1314787 RepID=A0A9P4I359_9PEZI|nr:Cloroperoxidase [Saccharata proteae CBS 121410]